MAMNYHILLKNHPDEMERWFPLRAYGIKKGSL